VRILFTAGERVFLQGFLAKTLCTLWCFAGHFVVNCVVAVVVMHHVLPRQKMRQVFKLFFAAEAWCANTNG
jgi:hypothetical protein